jgi:hypothetical protein
MLTELCKGFDFGISASTVLGTTSRIDTRMHQSTIYKDNTGCLELVNRPDQFHHPRTKHIIGIKWHHFCDAVKNGSIVNKKIDTTFQLTDPLTKLLLQHCFEMLCQQLMGW